MEKHNSYVEKTGTSKIDVVVSVIAEYLDYSETVPLSRRIAELKATVEELQALVKK